uniref:Putative serine/threonine protein kinase n=1 Tax=Pithovirus LCPAC302 TaxID=2506593 RepID=A0A481Z707_9VIRU|nr:MAG: putative serine/threonine protein kinase [Pithovirus LCPAC302]
MELIGYRVIRKLGKGAQGSVYLAVRNYDNRYVAIKEVKIPKGIKFQTNLERVLEEINILRSVSAEPTCNQYISCYVDHKIDSERGIVFLIMEYIDGPNLKEYIQPFYEQQDPVGLVETVFLVVKAITTALKHIHDRNILHQDIKPENIVINSQRVPKLVDFGVSCKTLPKYDDICLYPTKDLTVEVNKCCNTDGGTFMYIAPEWILDNIRYPQSDIFSLGATIYTILTGRVIWRAREIQESTSLDIILAMKSEQPEEIESNNILLNTLVNGMTRKDVLQRFTDDEVLNLLKDV